jgi:FAD:protein FMN transferase
MADRDNRGLTKPKMPTHLGSPRFGLTRRRFIRISAAAAGMALLPPLDYAHAEFNVTDGQGDLRIWRGVALGADAMLQLHHPDPEQADRLIDRCLTEVSRLEGIFSLYREGSALGQFNGDGRVDGPPIELVELLGRAEEFSKLTAGAFDVSVQPLWELYANHFSAPDPDPSGPSRAAITATLGRVGYDALEIDPARLSFAKPNMAVTLNGIAQGYITDRIVDLLRRAGVDRSLVDMGEIRTIGTRPSGGPWIVGLEDPTAPGHVAGRIEIENQAVATSGGYGTQFDREGRFNHLFEPATGKTSWRYLSVSVIAPDATTADALSTGFSLMSQESVRAALAKLGLKAHLVLPDGRGIWLGVEGQDGAAAAKDSH